MDNQASEKTTPENSSQKGSSARGRAALSPKDLLLRLGGLAFIDAVGLWLAYSLVGNGATAAAIILLIVTAALNWIYLADRLYPLRWLTPGILLMIMMVIYPLVTVIYVSFTNYSDGHILSKDQVLSQLQGKYYQAPNAVAYKWTAYRNADGKFKLLLQDPQNQYFLGTEGEGLKPFTVTGDTPATIDDYQKIDRLNTLKYLSALQKLNITDGDKLIRITSLDSAPQSQRQYSYDSGSDQLKDNESGKIYKPVRGTFTADDGSRIDPGFTTVVGLDNYTKVVSDPNIRGPFFGVFIWTFVFAFMSVLLTFSLGLAAALLLNDKHLPLKGLFRSIAIIPYSIPAFISALVWVGLLDTNYGPVNIMLKNIFGGAPDWFSDGTWAKAGILLINTWLGFPYMMLLCLGALQSIPTDMYEAADLDGASPGLQFRRLTLPLLLVSVAPLMIGSFAFNFNNFTLIELYNHGGPAIAGAATPAGQTDILLSYTYRLAFGGGQGADFGLASAIALFIFALVAGITIFNFRYTKQLEEV